MKLTKSDLLSLINETIDELGRPSLPKPIFKLYYQKRGNFVMNDMKPYNLKVMLDAVKKGSDESLKNFLTKLLVPVLHADGFVPELMDKIKNSVGQDGVLHVFYVNKDGILDLSVGENAEGEAKVNSYKSEDAEADKAASGTGNDEEGDLGASAASSHDIEDELSQMASYDYEKRMASRMGLDEKKAKLLDRLINESIYELIQEVKAKKKLN